MSSFFFTASIMQSTAKHEYSMPIADMTFFLKGTCGLTLLKLVSTPTTTKTPTNEHKKSRSLFVIAPTAIVAIKIRSKMQHMLFFISLLLRNFSNCKSSLLYKSPLSMLSLLNKSSLFLSFLSVLIGFSRSLRSGGSDQSHQPFSSAIFRKSSISMYLVESPLPASIISFTSGSISLSAS